MQLPPQSESLNDLKRIVKDVLAYGSPGNPMNQDIQENLVKLLDAYLEDLKAEADTVTHIVNYINEFLHGTRRIGRTAGSLFLEPRKEGCRQGRTGHQRHGHAQTADGNPGQGRSPSEGVGGFQHCAV